MAFFKIIRYKNLLMVLLTMVLTKYGLIDSIAFPIYLSVFTFLLFTFSILLITASGYVINDIYDVDTDLINKPSKVIISKKVSLSSSWKIYWVLSFLGLILGAYALFLSKSFHLIFIHIFSWGSLFIYAKYLKRLPFVGNFLVAGLCAVVIIYTLLIHQKTHTQNENFDLFLVMVITLYSFFAFISTLIREIIKDIEDINGDLKISAKTLPIVIGRKRASKVAFFFASILLITLALVLKTIKEEYLLFSYALVFLLLLVLYFMYLLWIAKSKKEFSKLSSMLKIIMFFGIASMLLFRLID